MASKRAREQAAARSARQAQREEFPFCEPRAAGMPGDCFPAGVLTVHEPWIRSAGGPLGDRRNMVTACAHHNNELSQGQRGWALAHGYLVLGVQGPAWLEAGGFQRD